MGFLSMVSWISFVIWHIAAPLCYILQGLYDDRFLVKPTKSAAATMPDADRELPYEGAEEMLLVSNVENREFLAELVTAVYGELPAP